jgi:hypothetical protein
MRRNWVGLSAALTRIGRITPAFQEFGTAGETTDRSKINPLVPDNYLVEQFDFVIVRKGRARGTHDEVTLGTLLEI